MCELRYFSRAITAKAKVAKSFNTLVTTASIASLIAGLIVGLNGHSLALLRLSLFFTRMFLAYFSCAQV